ncbi:MAG: DUF294 nucleotidyltransferase-like domain-containing protein [Flavobacteriaceae bacterium]|jgi:CBS domain-containing protein|nr:CBS domain-containing protein [Flavobacteriaceae bacterium]MDG1047880.1 DUF294 nucleotidyltransferase-like domain-containing protein [Flavobacteriaceae bacterium]MDG2317655.1 DUF294 nucleotidyltransferase-like domain-containing protein [Flavobacteriaceae bacterium]
MKNTISHRVADFLKGFPPFNMLSIEVLEDIAMEINIQYLDKEGLVFKEGDNPHTNFYVVHKGAVALRKAPQNEMVDLCDEGDIFGLRPLMAQENYKMEAKAYEETILYCIPIEVFKPYALKNKAIGNFLLESFASNTRNPYAKNHRGKLYGETSSEETEAVVPLFDVQQVRWSKNIISCETSTPITVLASAMRANKIGAILVLKDKLPIGIITDKDLRNKIGTGEIPISGTAFEIMSSPVITYPEELTVTQAQIGMMATGVSHLCITKDGTPHTKAVGIVSKHDIMLSVGNNPSVLIKAIQRASKTKEVKRIRLSIMKLLRGYLQQGIPMTITSKIISELNNACTRQIITLNLKKMETPPPCSFVWLAIGSQGRNEQLLQTDQDNAIIFEKESTAEGEPHKEYFLELAKKINKGLMKIGYEYCPADMMASNPKWCLDLESWKKNVSYWISNPGKNEVLLSSIFFDFNAVYGNTKLSDALSDVIFDTLKEFPVFTTHLASGALQSPPPSGFFRKFLVEHDGANKDNFDLKRRTLMPLTDAARVLVLSHFVKGINNTAARFEKLATLEPNNKDLYLSCSYATKALLKFRTKQGILHRDSGRYLDLNSLSKEERVKLKRTFKTIKEIQELINIRFKVSQLL